MTETHDINSQHSVLDTVEQWVSDSAAHIWQSAKDDPLGTLGTAAAIGVGGMAVGGALALKLSGYGMKTLVRRELMQAAVAAETETAGTAAGAQSPWVKFPGSSMISDPALNRYITSVDQLGAQGTRAGLTAKPAGVRITGVGNESPRSYGPNAALSTEAPSPLYMTTNDSFSHINAARIDTLLDMQSRSNMPASEYLAQLAQRTTVQPINANTFIARDQGYRVTVRLDEDISLRYKQGNLEVVDHDAGSSRLYSTDYGGLRATIYHGNSFGPRLNSLGARLATETVDGAEKQDWIKNWLYRDSDGQLLTTRFRALST